MRRSNPLALGLDVGTSAVKLGIFDSEARCLLSFSTPMETERHDDRVELDADKVFLDIRALLDRAASELGGEAGRLVGLGLAVQRSTVVFWNHAGPLGPAMTWQDVRAAETLRSLAQREPFIEEKTGLRLTPHYGAPKIRWAIEHSEPVQVALASGELLAGPLSSYLIWRLTGGATFAVDPTQAQRTLLFHLKTGGWDPTLCRWFGVPRAILPPIRQVRAAYGDFPFGGRRIPILASVGDTQGAFFAAGLGRKADLTIQYGTGAFVALYCGRTPLSCPGLLTSLYVSDKNHATHFVEGTVNSAGSLLDWLKRSPEMPHIRVAAERTLLLPALTGLGSPHWVPGARPALFGISTAGDVTELATEAIGFRIREILRLLESFGRRLPAKAFVSGGLTENPAFLQTQADILQMPLLRCQGEGSAAAGAALLVFGSKPHKPTVDREVRPDSRRSFPSPNLWARTVALAKTAERRPCFQATLWADKLRELRPLFFAHRGASHIAPENTLAAFDLAVRHGADGVEFDVRLTKDGVPVILHDSDLARTTGRSGFVEETVSRDLPPAVPKLEEALEFLPEHLLLYIEIKDDISGPKLWREAFRVAGKDRRAAFCSFGMKAAVKFKTEHPDFPVGGILGRRHPAIHPAKPLYPELDLLCFRDGLMTPPMIARCRLQTQMAFVWTVDRASAVNRFVDLGTDGIVTNRIDRFNARACARRRS
jgi:glycerol kinase